MITPEEVGRRIRTAREECKLTQADLGRLLSPQRSYAAVSDIERGRTRVDIELLSQLSEVLGKPLTYFTADGSPAPVVYRRGHAETDDQRRAADRAIERFKQFARERAARTRGSKK